MKWLEKMRKDPEARARFEEVLNPIFEEIRQKGFIQGCACAASTIIASHGIDTSVEEMMRACGIDDEATLIANEVDEYDMNNLLPYIREKAAYKAEQSFSQDFRINTDSRLTINHNLETLNVLVTVRENLSPYLEVSEFSIEVVDKNTIILGFSSCPESMELSVLVHRA